MTDFQSLPDLASRALGGGVPYADDELFAERENLVTPGPAVFDPERFGHKGKIYDGWETRRRREPGHDVAIVRLGAPGVVRGVVIDTAWFMGNYPPFASVEATSVEGYPSPEELLAADWQPIVERSPLQGDTKNAFPVSAGERFTHVRLSIYPDGGVARLRVHGEVLPDPRLLTATTDLAAAVNGGRVVDCSNMFYSSPVNLIMPGEARIMGDGWENARRRDDGNDFVTFALAAPGTVAVAELDTRYFVGNAGRPCAASTRAPHPWTTRVPGSSCCRAPGCSPTPRTGSGRPPTRSSRTSGWTSTRTAGWHACGCTAPCPTPSATRWACAGSTRCPRRTPGPSSSRSAPRRPRSSWRRGRSRSARPSCPRACARRSGSRDQERTGTGLPSVHRAPCVSVSAYTGRCVRCTQTRGVMPPGGVLRVGARCPRPGTSQGGRAFSSGLTVAVRCSRGAVCTPFSGRRQPLDAFRSTPTAHTPTALM
jgi:allantoicase